jgi:hypothetical protein
MRAVSLAVAALAVGGGVLAGMGAHRPRPARARRTLSPAATARARPKPLDIASATLQDRDRSGDASPGDEVVVRLRRPLTAARNVRIEDLPLVAPDEDWGEAARVDVAAADEVRVVLGRDPWLRLYGTYRPGTAGEVVTCIAAADGTVPVLVDLRDRASFVGDRFPDLPELRPRYGQLHAHTGDSDGALQPQDAFEMARRHGLEFFAVTDHLERFQLRADAWRRGREQADRADVPGSFVALEGYEWGGGPTVRGWTNHINVVGAEQMPGFLRTLSLGAFYGGLVKLRGPAVVGQFNHPGMKKPLIGGDNWNDFAYRGDADLRMKLITVATRSPGGEDNRESQGLIPALDHGWHVAPKGEEDNHRADWAHTRVRTGLWVAQLTRPEVLAALSRMATFYTDDPDASLKLRIDGEWLMGSTVYGGGPHRLQVEVDHRTRSASVGRVEIVGRGGAVVASRAGGTTPLHAEFAVEPSADAYFFARVVLEDEDTRLISAPVFVDR